jgi:glycerol-3-phosphate dehydrogenase (NAD(P)+)
MQIGIIGSGSFGTALAGVFGKCHDVLIYSINEFVVKEINFKHSNKNYLPKLKLSSNVSATLEISDLTDVDLVIFCVPSKVVDVVAKKYKPYYSNQLIISAIKGISEHGEVMTDVLENYFPSKKVFALSGPSIAGELCSSTTELVIAGEKNSAKKIVSALQSDTFLLKVTSDKLGVQLLGVIKHFAAILSGVCDGLNLASNTKASVITKLYRDFYNMNIDRIRKHTFVGYSGIGDLYVSTTSSNSRNYQFGYLIAKGMTILKAKEKIGQTVEGYETLRALKKCGDYKHFDERILYLLRSLNRISSNKIDAYLRSD